MPKDALHYNGVEHRDVHNAYGYYFHMASVEGLLRRGGGNERPFVLSRAFFAGTQKVGPVWTGDNTADWTQLRVSVPMCLTLGLTGIAFTGADVGGFFGNPDPELLTRWYQLGAYYPFFRAHAHLDTKRREPWLFGEPYTTLMREAVHSRYSLLPYVYTLFKEASVTGVPLMRPLWMEFPEDISTFERDEEFLLGPSLLVHGVYSQGATSETVYLPGTQKWYDVKTGATYPAGQKVNVPVTMDGIPVFQRAGSIIARKQRRRRSSTQMETDPYTLVVALNSTYEASGELYIDDGKSYDFEQGAFIYRQFKFSKGRLTSTTLAPVKTGSKVFTTSCLVERIVILGVRAKDLTIGKNAIVEQDERRIETDIGPPLLQRGASSTALILRLPNVRISDNWSIKLV
jgi:alpha 1,3-glucosidase